MIVKNIGYSTAGRPIKGYFAGTGPLRLLLCGAHHANEWITSCVLDKFISEYEGAAKRHGLYQAYSPLKKYRRVLFCIVPKINPDGVAIVTKKCTATERSAALAIACRYPQFAFPDGWKANLRGVDLNLNYPAGWKKAVENKAALGIASPSPRDWPGSNPFSEPETRAVASLTASFNPHIIISFHTQGREIYWNYGEMEPPGSREMADAMADASGCAAVKTPVEAGYAGYKDWFIKCWNRPGFTVEAGLGENPLPFSDFDDIYSECKKIIDVAVDKGLQLML